MDDGKDINGMDYPASLPENGGGSGTVTDLLSGRPAPAGAAPAVDYDEEYSGGGSKKRGTALIYTFAFLIPFALMTLAFRNIGIFPFGDRQIMVIDSWHQYFPFLNELHTKLLNIFDGQTSLLYSWNTGAGTNFLVLMSYYAASPLYLLSVLFPKEYLREFMALATVIKIALSGLFFAVYLNKLHNRKDAAVIAFSTLYALSAYAVGYYWCIMWLDCMALLPLIILGLNRLMEGRGFLLYVTTLGLALVSNYYIGYFLCEFILLYYFVLYVSKYERGTAPAPKTGAHKTVAIFGGIFAGAVSACAMRIMFRDVLSPLILNVVSAAAAFIVIFVVLSLLIYKENLRFILMSGKAAGASLLGVALSAFMLLPTYKGLQLTANLQSAAPSSTAAYNNLIDILTGLLTGRSPAIRAGLPNIACGMLIVLLCVLYFAAPKIKAREKLAHGALLVFLLFSFNINQLDYIWHGFHFPNEIHYRYAFVFTFLLIHMAYNAYINLEDIRAKAAGAAGGVILAYILLAERWFADSQYFENTVFYVSMLMLVWYLAFIMMYKHGKMAKPALAVFLILLACLEGGIAAFNGANATGTSGREDYPPNVKDVRASVADVYASDSGMYRLEMKTWYSTNDPAIYGYRGVSQFSSEANSKFSRILEILGIASDVGSNRYLYSTPTPVVNAMLSVKYVMSRWEFPETKLYEKRLHNGEVETYENKYWLPMGFVVRDDILNWIDWPEVYDDNGNLKENKGPIPYDQKNIFITQNKFLQYATGIMGDVFRTMTPDAGSKNEGNMKASRHEHGVYYYSQSDGINKATYRETFYNEKDQHVFLYVRSPRSKNVVVNSIGSPQKFESERGVTVDLGYLKAGQAITVSLEFEPGSNGGFHIFAAGFNEDLFAEAYQKMRSQGLEVTEFTDTSIKGTVNADELGILFMSIPFEAGWTAKVDGEKVDIVPIADGFIGVPLTPGLHEIEMNYFTDGLMPGLILSAAALLITVMLAALSIYRRRNGALPGLLGDITFLNKEKK